MKHFRKEDLQSWPRALRLRGHHLICLNFYKGQGYPEAYKRVVRRALAKLKSEGALVVRGADDICRGCPDLKGGVCLHSPGAEKEVTAMDELALDLLGLGEGVRVTWGYLQMALRNVFSHWHGLACQGCEWRKDCEHNRDYGILLLEIRRSGSN